MADTGFEWCYSKLRDEPELRTHVERVASLLVELCQSIPSEARNMAILQMGWVIQQLDLEPSSCTREALSALWAIRGEFESCAIMEEWPILVHAMVRHLVTKE